MSTKCSADYFENRMNPIKRQYEHTPKVERYVIQQAYAQLPSHPASGYA